MIKETFTLEQATKS